MTDEEKAVAIAVARERLRIARDLVTSTLGDMPWMTETIRREGRDVQVSLSALDLTVEQHLDYIKER